MISTLILRRDLILQACDPYIPDKGLIHNETLTPAYRGWNEALSLREGVFPRLGLISGAAYSSGLELG